MVDTSKKSNRKCEHCKFWNRRDENGNDGSMTCQKSGAIKNYYKCCKHFEWKDEYFTPEALEALRRANLDKAESALARKDKEIEKWRAQFVKLQKERAMLSQQVLELKREYYGTNNLMIGSLLYRSDYELTGEVYSILDLVIVGEGELLAPGEYYIIHQTNVTMAPRMFVAVDSVNIQSFFTTPELAHEHYKN